MTGFSIRIFLPDGSPEGVRLVSKSHWSGVGVICSRSQYLAASKRNEFQSTGVYVLLGQSDSGSRKLYVGEGDNMDVRIRAHIAAKDWWDEVIVFTKTDGSLNKAHVRYLEAQLVELAKANGSFEVDNGTQPSPPAPTEADKADLDGFLDDMLTIYPLLGVDAFASAPKLQAIAPDVSAVAVDPSGIVAQVPSADNTLHFTLAGADAKGYQTSEGTFVLLKGSRGLAQDRGSIVARTRDRRDRLREQGLLEVDPENPMWLILTTDQSFSSPSAAGEVMYGGNVNGRREWKTADGRSLADYEADELAKTALPVE